ncbi:Hypothetical protein NTJ_02810 [Nesidiocoris tenuis]|uniref:Uncharacterized protein n=1 Tax=Nesidiocoris tenuis TaxID=355587 RepID=A0ABN7AFH8_9HEMI|nr:Hypothetical protein NTJ_02810 [Nesidiocoris tenuis]
MEREGANAREEPRGDMSVTFGSIGTDPRPQEPIYILRKHQMVNLALEAGYVHSCPGTVDSGRSRTRCSVGRKGEYPVLSKRQVAERRDDSVLARESISCGAAESAIVRSIPYTG